MSETPDAFATLDALIRLAADPAACKARIDQLRKAIDKAEAAEAKLAERQAVFDQRVVQQRAELDERKAKLAKLAVDLHTREAAAEQIIARDKANRRDRYQPLAEGMTIVRE